MTAAALIIIQFLSRPKIWDAQFCGMKKNRGKGHALKTGFEYILNNTNESIGVVTADADGQHLVKDILSIAAEVYNQKDKIVLGERKFVGKVPLRSKVGNTATRGIFTLVSGQKILDTQTGLRGFPIKLLPWLLSVEGERFEYEMNMLLEAGKIRLWLCSNVY